MPSSEAFGRGVGPVAQPFGVGERISGVLWEIWSKCTLPKNAVELPKPSQIISFQENNPAWNCFSVFRSVGEHEMLIVQKRRTG